IREPVRDERRFDDRHEFQSPRAAMCSRWPASVMRSVCPFSVEACCFGDQAVTERLERGRLVGGQLAD
ncbi:MAG: hypothetical protein JWN39_3462, partial [Ilumatobacteraceae bacterium]|nr:hypothetical protein [Ilumatobacteraceae bacterium]